jgi:DMSO/TMAO reductase YedYZ molybdopterin-dependent catalytic subunit
MDLPPNQALAAAGKWPVVGESVARASQPNEPWSVVVYGLVNKQEQWSLAGLHESFTWEERTVDIHCVTRWSKPGARFGGVRLLDVLEHCQIKEAARYVSFGSRSDKNHNTSLSYQAILELDPLIAFSYEGKPLEECHGGPIRLIVGDRYFYKSLKWLEKIEVLANDRLGSWEGESGYHNNADPWKEERYIVSGVSRKELRALIERRDLAGREFLSIQCSGMELAGLNAAAASLRNASFQKANLRGANFDRARLANAHFEEADLQGASFLDADLEGADFRGADLRGINLIGSSLSGAVFCPEPHDQSGFKRALIDKNTQYERSQLSALSDAQREFLLNWLERKA